MFQRTAADLLDKIGTIVPVAPGLFRSKWLPRQIAQYATTQCSELKPRDVVAERDFGFQKEVVVEAVKKQAQKIAIPKPPPIDPQRATEILSAFLPPQLVFHRAPIKAPSSPSSPLSINAPKASASEPQTSESSETAVSPASGVASQSPIKPALQPIFGSVSPGDVAQSVKALLIEHEEGKKIILGAENVEILPAKGGGGVEVDRVKAIGEFEVVISVKGGDMIKRVLSVKAMERVGEGGFLGSS
ncbi:uncharacterized protein KY384_000741 [Bacidia gigantensis]|uniref:uncharacterized protein n=1 Tax=Bacidia gigantensis TaxID=2732470 RepID=UPI001D03C5DF|nr:uncharacterized protein KY384_000741 [Bacidia gigantensis]KAG8525979.1 hypothetical protein KY384_000741 [Bacidia gigantensis]